MTVNGCTEIIVVRAITNYPLPITHYQLPITHYPLPITNH
ncbi:MAG: alpha/beta hydrolase [Oscillatoriales cyanobacterium]|nr:MAG: alpha/beta hydrolase [Oscillatoriales cyanobacterium]TAH20483.1 MAG: alpha/beta hydrolase [Oscillatoriales cyanobacterium]